MTPLALMNLGLAPVPTYQPPKPRNRDASHHRARESDERRAEIVEMIGRDGPMTKAQICAAFRINPKTADRYVASLAQQGMLAPCVIHGGTYYWRPWRDAE